MQRLVERETGLPDRPQVLAEHNRALRGTIYRTSQNRYLLGTLGSLRCS